MLQNAALLMCLLLALWNPRVESQVHISFDSMSYDQLISAIMDNPVEVKSWAKEVLSQDKTGINPELRIHSLIAYIFARNELADTEGIDSYKSILEDEASIAKQKGLGAEHTKLLLLSVMVRPQDFNVAYLNARMGEILKEVEGWNRPRYVAEVYIDFAIFFREVGQKAIVHELLHKGQKAIQDDTYPDDTIHYLIKNFVALVLAEGSDLAMAWDLYNEVAEFCRKKPLRYLGGVLSYNMATKLQQSNDPQDWLKAEALFREAAALGKSSQIERLVAFANIGLGKVHIKLNHLEQAHAAFDHAIRILSDLNETFHLADAYKLKIQVFNLQKNWNKVLEYSRKADGLYAPDWDLDHLDIRNYMHKALAGLKRFEIAYQTLLDAYQLQEKNFSKQQKEQLDKLKVELGLQVSEQKALLLQKENEQQAQSIARARIMLMVVISGFTASILIAILLLYALRKSRQLKETQVKNRFILNSIEEAVISIDRDLRIQGQQPPSLRQLFMISDNDKSISSLTELFSEKTDLGPDERQILMECLRASLGEHEISWELNGEHLPKELTIGKGQRYLSLDWQPVKDSEKRVKEIFLVIKDRTRQKELERDVDEVKGRARRQDALVAELIQGNGDLIASFIQDLSRFTAELPHNLGEEAQAALLRHLHTCKGNARSLGLKHLANIIHELEDALSHKSSGHEPDDRDSADLSPLRAALEEYNHVVFEVFRFHSKRSRQQAQTSLINLVGEHFSDIRQRFKHEGIEVAEINVQDQFLHWSEDTAKAAGEILVHGLSNSADHGFILPKQRGEAIRPPRFQVSAEEADHRLILKIKDNGQGLNFSKIHQIAERKGFEPAPGRPLTDVLFLDGTSTCESATHTSGRGVGLSAILEICRDRNGTVSLLPNPDVQGTMLYVVIPLNPAGSQLLRPA